MTVYVIEDMSGGMPVYFSLRVKEDMPSAIGQWLGELPDALQFAREEDAENFTKIYLRHILHINIKKISF